MRLALLAAVLLTGCTSTRYIDATSPAEIGSAAASVVGHEAEIGLVSGDRYRGEVQFLRPDSTAWADAEALYAVPTADVRSLVVDNRRRRLTRGALIGGGSAFGLCFLLGSALGSDDSSAFGSSPVVGLIVGASCIPAGAFYGVIGGAIASRRTEIVLYDPADEPAAPPE